MPNTELAGRTRPPLSASGVLALACTIALAVAGCSVSPPSNRAGGPPQTTLTLASLNDGIDPPVSEYQTQVEKVSDGTLHIKVATGWKPGPDVGGEAGLLSDVASGKVDMAWVGARAFDSIGETTFPALLAPLLVDSYDLEGAIFEAGIPQAMLESVKHDGLEAVAVLPGPLRKVMGVDRDFRAPADFSGATIWRDDGDVSRLTFDTLGATSVLGHSGMALDGKDGVVTQLGAIVGNGYTDGAQSVTGNLNVVSRPLVFVINKKVLDSLDPAHQNALRAAGEAAVVGSLKADRAEDVETGATICRTAMKVLSAEPGQLAGLRHALDPVYSAISQDPASKDFLAQIEQLKADVGAAPDSVVCASDSTSTGEASVLDGSQWQVSFTRDELAASDLYDTGEIGPGNYGDFTMTFNPDGTLSSGGTYSVRGDVLTMLQSNGEKWVCRWSVQSDTLTLIRDDAIGVCPTPIRVKPWTRVP